MEDASDCPDGFSEVIQLSQLPVTHRLLAGPRYNSVDTLMEDLNTWGRENGLAFVKTQASNYSEGKARRYTVICDRGRSRPSNAHSRKTSTTKTGCPWRGVAKALKANGWLWEFEISKARRRRSSPDPLQDYNFDSVPRGDTQSQIVVALTGPDDEDEEGIEYDGGEEEGGGL